MLWFIDMTVATCHIQYTFLSLCQFFHETKQEKSQSPPFLYHTKMAADSYYMYTVGAQSSNTERTSLNAHVQM